jgi:hypothetical protein
VRGPISTISTTTVVYDELDRTASPGDQHNTSTCPPVLHVHAHLCSAFAWALWECISAFTTAEKSGRRAWFPALASDERLFTSILYLLSNLVHKNNCRISIRPKGAHVWGVGDVHGVDASSSKRCR